jgi:hypothetical protein
MMKAQINKRDDLQIQGILTLAFYFTVMAGILVFTESNNEPANAKGTNKVFSANVVKDLSAADSAAGINNDEIYMMELLNEMLIPAAEPTMLFSDVSGINFPVELNREQSIEWTNNDYLLKSLSEKNNELSEFYHLVWKTKESLVQENEQPLKLENWMTNDAFWSHENKTANLTD